MSNNQKIRWKGNKEDGIETWYHNDTNIIEKIINWKNHKYNGETIINYSDGKLKIIIPYNNNVINGHLKFYYPSGKLLSDSYFNNNILDKNEFYYYENGNLQYEILWDDGKLIYLKHYNQDGILISYQKI